jgi:hypothetical protein
MYTAMLKRWGLLFVILAVALAGCQAAPMLRRREYRTRGEGRPGTIRASVSASGSIAPAEKVDLNFGVPGTVARLPCRGQPQAGDVLARLIRTNPIGRETSRKRGRHAKRLCNLPSRRRWKTRGGQRPSAAHRQSAPTGGNPIRLQADRAADVANESGIRRSCVTVSER